MMVMKYKKLALILGNCLFPSHQRLHPDSTTLFFMAEDHGLCTHFKYHKQKLVLFLSAMRSHAEEIENGHALDYYQLSATNADDTYEDKLRQTLEKHKDIEEIVTYDIEDHFFEKRIRKFCQDEGVKLIIVESAGFITSKKKFKQYDERVKKPFMQTFYIQQRKDLGILLSDNGEPLYGKWSFDEENRKKLPKNITIPHLPNTLPTKHTEEVQTLIDNMFSDHSGSTRVFNGQLRDDRRSTSLIIF